MNEQAMGAGRVPVLYRPPAIRLADQLTVWAVWTLMLAGVANEVLGQTALIGFGFYTFHVVDPAVVLTFLAWSFYQTERAPTGGLVVAPVLLVGLLLIVNFGRGITGNSASALLWARGTLEIGGLLLLGTVCSPTPAMRAVFRRALLTAGFLIAGLTFLRVIFGPQLFMTIGPVEEGIGINDGGRPLQATGAFILGMSATLLCSEVIRKGLNRGWPQAGMMLVLLFALFASGQGTATLATVAMLMIVTVFERGGYRMARGSLAVMGLVAITIVLIASGFDMENIKIGNWDLARRSGTYEGRLAIWSGLKKVWPTMPLSTQMFGMPGGEMPYLIVTNWKMPAVWTGSIHSMYYGAIPMMGYLGLVAYVAVLVLLTVGSLRNVLRRHSPSLTPAYPLAFCVGTVILAFSYENRNQQLFGLFFALWWLRFDAVSRRQAAAARRMGATMSTATAEPGVSAGASLVPPRHHRRNVAPLPRS
jgi:hypothetical protein